ncbi:transpeptidase family protein [bacterium]|nr:transpeptidase family protein [bacterium]
MRSFYDQGKPIEKTEMRRLRFLGFLFTLSIVVILVRLFMFQVWNRDPWNALAPSQYQQYIKRIAHRGVIYDRDMNILAMDLPTLSMAIDATQVEDREAAANIFASVLKGNKNNYLNILEENKDKRFVWIENDITTNQRDSLYQLQISGLIPVQTRKRVHPYEMVGKQVIGITNGEHRGVSGVELALDDTLRGEDGWGIYQKDALKRNYLSLDYPVKESRNGHHVVLTLNHAYQTIVEEELQKGIIYHGAKRGSAVLMDPFTGEILVMASILGGTENGEEPDFDMMLQNQPVQVDFEPGSTFKIVTAAAALEEGLFHPNSIIFCENGSYQFLGHTIHDHNQSHGMLTLSQVVEYSSNIGISKVGEKLGENILYKYIQNFGFGNRTGIGLPGEVPGILRPVYRWSDFSIAAVSFGQEISVTTLQETCMISAVANGGKLFKPVLYKAIIDDNGNITKSYSGEVIRRVISEGTADQLRIIMENVVNQGSGIEAKVEGVRIAGKTGTAQKSEPGFEGYRPGVYVSSFAGFWPADTPMFAMVIVVDEPQRAYWGSQSAAPIFSRIVSRIAGFPLEYGPSGRPENENRTESRVVFSSYYDNRQHELESERESSSVYDSPYHVPQLNGLSVREALKRLSSRGIEGRVEGRGVVIEQSPKPGEKVVAGMVCYLWCQEPDESVKSK